MDHGSEKAFVRNICPQRTPASAILVYKEICLGVGLEEICEDGNSESISCCFNAGAEGAFGNCCWIIPCTRPYQNIDRGCTEAFKHCKK